MISLGSRLTLLLTITASSVFGQYLGYTPINQSDVSKWIPKFQIEYYGTYHFGDSEGESTLILFSTGTEIIAQVKSGTWNTGATDWIWLYDNLTNAKIDKDGQFYSDEYKGEFVFYDGQEKRQKCLKIFDPWSRVTKNKGEYELGWKLGSNISSMYSGKYSIASTQRLDPSEIKKMSSEELKIMRNEIFARYGYRFKEGGKMDSYFKSQRWYRPQHADVTKFLTTLEKQNIELIQSEESRH